MEIALQGVKHELGLASTQTDVHIKFNQNSLFLFELKHTRRQMLFANVCIMSIIQKTHNYKTTGNKHMEYPHMYKYIWKLIVLKVFNLTLAKFLLNNQTNVQESFLLGTHILRVLKAGTFFIPSIFRAKVGDCKN